MNFELYCMWFLAFSLLCAVLRMLALLKHYFREEDYDVVIESKHIPFAMCVMTVQIVVLTYLVWLYFYA